VTSRTVSALSGMMAVPNRATILRGVRRCVTIFDGWYLYIKAMLINSVRTVRKLAISEHNVASNTCRPIELPLIMSISNNTVALEMAGAAIF
jgi:small ligand-binding sensory domain FIST